MRKTTTDITCDRCGSKVPEIEVVHYEMEAELQIVGEPVYDSFDLCRECTTTLYTWMLTPIEPEVATDEDPTICGRPVSKALVDVMYTCRSQDDCEDFLMLDTSNVLVFPGITRDDLMRLAARAIRSIEVMDANTAFVRGDDLRGKRRLGESLVGLAWEEINQQANATADIALAEKLKSMVVAEQERKTMDTPPWLDSRAGGFIIDERPLTTRRARRWCKQWCKGKDAE